MNGQDRPLTEALDNPVGHPNCVRTFAPVIPETPATHVPSAAGRPTPAEQHLPDEDPDVLATGCAAKSKVLAELDDPTPERRDPAVDDLADGTLLTTLLDDVMRLAFGGTP